MQKSSPFLSLQDAKKVFSQKTIFESLNLNIDKSDFVSILGRSGSGKSTILKVLAGLEPLTSGHLVREPNVKCGFVFQEPQLLEWRTVLENVLLPLQIGPSKNTFSKDQALSKARTLLKSVSLDGCEDIFPHQLSGGMKMRVSLARALVAQPEILFLDEPLAALDEMTRFEMQDLLLRLQSELNFAAVFVTHSFSEAAYLSNRIYILHPAGSGHLKMKNISYSKARNSLLRSNPEFNETLQSLTAEFYHE